MLKLREYYPLCGLRQTQNLKLQALAGTKTLEEFR